MKHQALFSSKDKGKKLNCRLLQVLFGTLRVKVAFQYQYNYWSLVLNFIEMKDRLLYR